MNVRGWGSAPCFTATPPRLLIRLLSVVLFFPISVNTRYLPSSVNKGRTDTGDVGMFPQAYTTPNPPEGTPTPPVVEVHEPEPELQSPTTVQTLREEPTAGSMGPLNPDPSSSSTPRATDRELTTNTDGEIDGLRLVAGQRLAENSGTVNETPIGPSTLMHISAPPIEVELILQR